MAVNEGEAGKPRRPWRKPKLTSQQVLVPANLLVCSQFCCNIDGSLQCVANSGVCSTSGGIPGSGC